jgi:hypothetical protein
MKSSVQDIKMDKGKHCLFISLKNLARSENVELSETDIFFSCDGFNVSYSLDLAKMWLASSERIITNFAELVGARNHCYFGMDVADYEDEICSVLSGNHMVLLVVRSDCLLYNPAFQRSLSSNHIILLTGLDTDLRTADIIDSSYMDDSGNILTFHGELNWDTLIKGIWGIAWFEFPETCEVSDQKVMCQSTEHLQKFLSGKQVDEHYFEGIPAYRKYIEDFERLLDMEQSDFTETCKHIYYCLRVGGIIHLNAYLQEFIAMHQDSFNEPPDIWHASAHQLEGEWKNFLLHLYKVGVQGKKEKIRSLISSGQTLLSKQERLMHDLVFTLKASL